MNPRPEFTAADADEAARRLQRDPAAQAYGDHLRRAGVLRDPMPMDPYAREAERVRIFTAACRANAAMGG